MTKAAFYKLLDGIKSEALRERVEDSAMTNAGDTMIERGYQATDSHLSPWGDKTEEFWEAAIATAKMILDCPKDYYPELYQS